MDTYVPRVASLPSQCPCAYRHVHGMEIHTKASGCLQQTHNNRTGFIEHRTAPVGPTTGVCVSGGREGHGAGGRWGRTVAEVVRLFASGKGRLTYSDPAQSYCSSAHSGETINK